VNKNRTISFVKKRQPGSSFMKTLKYAAFFVFGLVVSYLMISLGVVGNPVDAAIASKPNGTLIEVIASVFRPSYSQTSQSWDIQTYLSFLSVMMTAITAVLAALAIGIGIIAAYSFREIKEEAQKAAKYSAEAAIKIALSDDVIHARIDKIAFAIKPTPAMEELEEAYEDSENSKNGRK
jgi:hypothetical protein